jgi:hypothetical protein
MRIVAILSMLHEPATADGGRDSGTRRFRGEPVLWWTLGRLKLAEGIDETAVMCWDDQLAAVRPIADEREAFVSVRTPRSRLAEMDAVAASRRWSDGWRGGLLGTCEFDKGFYGPWVRELCRELEGDAVLLVDPSAGLIDPGLVEGVIAHARANPAVDLCFSQAAPGLSAVLLRPAVIEPLATAKLHPGLALAYRPDQPRRDPIASEACAPIPAGLARTTSRFTLDSSRQVARVDEATAPLNGELPKVPALRLLEVMDGVERVDRLPREVVVELNVQRATRPIFWPGERLNIRREPMPLDMAKAIFGELAAEDDMRLVLGGLGDPLLREDIFAIIESARQAGIGRIAIETDLVGIDAGVAERLAESAVDVVSVCLPATNSASYAAVMGVDRLDECLTNLKAFLDRRGKLGRGTPLVAPVFVKCQSNLGEMEAWYDHWLNVLGSAVIISPSDFGRRIADVAAADMSPPKRVGCRRLAGRMVVLCDGKVVACEEDVAGELVGGVAGEQSMSDIWTKGLEEIRQLHRTGCWNNRRPCSDCRMWHRA